MEEIVNTLINSKDKIKFIKEASDKKVKFDMSNKHYICNTTVVMWKYNYILYKEIHILFMTTEDRSIDVKSYEHKDLYKRLDEFMKDICDMYTGDKGDNTKNKILKMLD